MKIQAILLSVTVLILAILFFTLPAFHDGLLRIFELFKEPQTMRDYIASYGALAPIVSALLMVFQSVAAPLPAFLITFVNGLLFGVWWGTVLSWSSAMVGAMVCFFIARYLGRPAVVKLVTEPALAASDGFFERYGKHAVLIARLVPIISFDVISYGAGLTGMRFIGFWTATGVGQLPATILYSYLGNQMTNTIKILFWTFGIVIAIAIIIVLIKRRSKLAIVLLIALSIPTLSCSREIQNHLATSVQELSVDKPIYIDRATKSVWLFGYVQSRAFNTSKSGNAQYHAIVWKRGRAKRNALFLTHATDVHVHQALVEVGAQPGNNLTLNTWDERFEPERADADLRVEGSQIEIAVQWKGLKKAYDLSEILEDTGKAGIDFRFGGNLAHVKKWKSGCVACLYSCPGGKVSNASYTIRDFVDEVTKFRAREDLLPPDNTNVILILKVKSLVQPKT